MSSKLPLIRQPVPYLAAKKFKLETGVTQAACLSMVAGMVSIA
ncbi:hypothetical protein [Actinobaculum massiliense]|nr:hypothetical protein [Actinobaculum massiliense]MDK8319645.1 hypothetical protein [Actinobaculum massiliense]MDK8566880.1 hypothetical protein [Actinobaculum massiliense]